MQGVDPLLVGRVQGPGLHSGVVVLQLVHHVGQLGDQRHGIGLGASTDLLGDCFAIMERLKENKSARRLVFLWLLQKSVYVRRTRVRKIWAVACNYVIRRLWIQIIAFRGPKYNRFI